MVKQRWCFGRWLLARNGPKALVRFLEKNITTLSGNPRTVWVSLTPFFVYLVYFNDSKGRSRLITCAAGDRQDDRVALVNKLLPTLKVVAINSKQRV